MTAISEAFGAFMGVLVFIIVLVGTFFGTAVLAGLWFRLFMDVAGLR